MQSSRTENSALDNLSAISFETTSEISDFAENNNINDNVNSPSNSFPAISTVEIGNSQGIRIGNEILHQAPVIYNVDVLHMHKTKPVVLTENGKLVTEKRGNRNFKYSKFMRKKVVIIGILIVIILILLGIVLVVISISKNNEFTDNEVETTTKNDLTTEPIETSTLLTTETPSITTLEPTQPSPDPGFKFNLITKEEWGAKDPLDASKVKLFENPLKAILIGHVRTENICMTIENCTERMHVMQRKAFSYGYNDIPHNFLIGGDGTVFEGLGWDVQGIEGSDGITAYYDTCLGISYIGNYTETAVNQMQLNAIISLLKLGVELGKILPDFHLFSQNGLTIDTHENTLLLETIQKLPNYVPVVPCFYRRNWEATAFKKYIKRISDRQNVYVNHIPEFEECFEFETCKQKVRAIQRNDKEKPLELPEIRYNFVIGGNGLLFSGRGWDYAGEHFDISSEDEKQLIRFGFIGNFSGPISDQNSINIFNSFLEQGIKLGKLDANFTISGEVHLIPQNL